MIPTSPNITDYKTTDIMNGSQIVIGIRMPDVFVELERWIKCGEKSHWGECAKFDESDLCT